MGADDATRVAALLGGPVPADSEAWSCALESLDYTGQAEHLCEQAEGMAHGPGRNAVLQEAHDAMRLAADWELEARESAGLPLP